MPERAPRIRIHRSLVAAAVVVAANAAATVVDRRWAQRLRRTQSLGQPQPVPPSGCAEDKYLLETSSGRPDGEAIVGITAIKNNPPPYLRSGRRKISKSSKLGGGVYS